MATGIIDNIIKRVTYTLIPADIQSGTLRNIIESPGSGYYINILSLVTKYIYGTTPFTTANSVLFTQGILFYGTTYKVDAAASWFEKDWNNTITTASAPAVINQPLSINTSATSGEGDGTVKVDIIYTIEAY